MKRQPALRRLSSEHHRALVLAKRLRGAADDDAGPLRQLMQQLLSSWQTEVEPHFALEERYLLPSLARCTAPDAPLIVETLRQHVQLRAWVDEVREADGAGVAVDAGLLQRLGDGLQQHVRFEENELFAAVEAQLPAEQLARLQRLLDH